MYAPYHIDYLSDTSLQCAVLNLTDFWRICYNTEKTGALMTKKQTINILYWTALAAIAFYFAYSKGWILADFESISPKQAYELLHNDDNVTLLDVRTPGEFSQEHIAGATLIPVQMLSENMPMLANVKDKKIIVYCHSGNRSVAASRILVQNGFVPLNVKGGISGWKSEGFEVVR